MKYEFANVLVADTRLLMNLSEPRNQPRVLVLNSRLDETCSRHSAPSSSSSSQPNSASPRVAAPNCSNCCLRIEQSEFKKRTNLDEHQHQAQPQQCFANCSERRHVNVELNTESQIHGKLVLLALTRGLPSALLKEGSAALKCQTETSWHYSLFERQQLNHHDRPTAAAAAANRQRPQLAQYSRLKPNQLASLRVGALAIAWNSQLRREVISLSIQSNAKLAAHSQQRVYTKETLLVAELSCRAGGADFGSAAWTGRLHLLALINRELGRSPPADKPPATATPATTTTGTSTSTSTSTTLPLDENYPQPDDGPNSIDIDRRSEGPLSSLVSARSPHSAYNQSGSFVMDGGGGFTTDLAPGNQRTDLNQAAGADALGESIRMRLKSSGFLLFTVSSSFVILAYTLCLLIYLKGRRQSAAARPRRLSARQRPHQREQQAQQQSGASSGNDASALAERSMRISEPYNLQMPEPTRTRLEMMLRSTTKCETDDDVAPSGRGAIGQQRLLGADDQRRSRKRRRATTGMMIGFPLPGQLGPASLGCGGKQRDELAYQAAESGDRSPSVDLSYGTLQVVRAIRQAAAVASYRLRASRYEPNLNVIHESDLEHLQHSAAAAAAAAATEEHHCRFADQNEDELEFEFGPMKSAATQIDHLVRDALNLECSHFIERIQQPSATLFSRPIEDAPNFLPADRQVSRSGILKLVKQSSQTQLTNNQCNN